MLFDFSEMQANKIYHTMTQAFIPRPIAWVLSENPEQQYNLAPFSYFTPIASDPPLLMISLSQKSSGEDKDTGLNIEATKRCVVHIADVSLAADLTASASELPREESELLLIQRELSTEQNWPLPRVAVAPIAAYCTLHDVILCGNAPQKLLFLKIEQLYINDQCIEHADGRSSIDALKVNPLARLGGGQYANLADILTIARPK